MFGSGDFGGCSGEDEGPVGFDFRAGSDGAGDLVEGSGEGDVLEVDGDGAVGEGFFGVANDEVGSEGGFWFGGFFVFGVGFLGEFDLLVEDGDGFFERGVVEDDFFEGNFVEEGAALAEFESGDFGVDASELVSGVSVFGLEFEDGFKGFTRFGAFAGGHGGDSLAIEFLNFPGFLFEFVGVSG